MTVADRSYDFDALEPIEAWLAHHAMEVDHVHLSDRSSSHVAEPLGRFNIDIKGWLDAGDVDTATLEELGTDAVIARQVLEWLRAMARTHTVRGQGTFRVRFYGPKGIACIHSSTFYCTALEDMAPKTQPTAALPDLDELDLIAAGPAMTAVGAAHRNFAAINNQFMQMHFSGFERLARMHESMLSRLLGALEDANETNRTLTESMIEFRRVAIDDQERELAAERKRFRKQQQRLENQDLARAALDKVTDTVKVGFATLKGLPPEILDVVEVIKEQPAFMELVRRPGFKSLLKNQEMREMITETLSEAVDTVEAVDAAEAHDAGEVADGAAGELEEPETPNPEEEA